MIKKRLLSMAMVCLLCCCAGFGLDKGSATFAAEAKQSNSNENTKAELTQVVKKVKQRVNIPKQCTEFDYHMNKNEYGGTYYYLYWSAKKEQTGVNVTADANGNITRYSIYEDRDTEEEKITYLKSELEATAREAAEKINPVTKGHMQLTSSIYLGQYNNLYQYIFSRVENGIAMKNYVSISISAADKEVTSYSANWLFDTDIPDHTVGISKEIAKEKVKAKMDMELKYLTSYEWKDGETKKDVFLAYVPTMNYISIDAKTGETYLTSHEWVVKETDAENKMEEDVATAAGADYGALSDEEIQALDVLDTLIDQETAIKKITSNKSLLLDKTAISITARLRKWEYGYYWNIYFEDPREPDYNSNDYYRAYASADVDAKTGEILSFYASMNDSKQPAKLLSNSTCQKKFEAFVTSQNKERFENSKLTEKQDSHYFYKVDDTRVYDGVRFQYCRMNEGVPYEDNYITGCVDRNTGKVYQYNYNWYDNITFQSPKDAMSSDKAMDCYLNMEGFRLVYEDNVIHTYDKAYEGKDEYYYNEDAYTVAHEIRLVYSIADIANRLISPFTGKEMDNQGKEITKKAAIENYSDIAGHPYEREIRLLSDIGLGYKNGRFNPNSYVTKEQLVQFVEAIGLHVNEDDMEALKESRVTRIQAAQFVIHCMGLDKIAKMENIFVTGYTDEASIGKELLGTVALCKGLGVLQYGEDNTFGVDEKLTRAEAAKLVMDIRQY